jgi:tRNA-splicing ligase RtcB
MFKKIAPSTYEIPREGAMRVPGLIVATAHLMQTMDLKEPLEQVRNVACLPGIVGYSIAMPDIHWGYGFPIGGVAAMDVEDGVISPGGVGYDINCGVRLALAPIPYKDLSHDKKDKLIYRIFSHVPSGVGRGHRDKGLSDTDYEQLICKGARWSIEQGWGFSEDLDHIESGGVLEGAALNAVSLTAKQRGRLQLGTIGSGNHFVEIGAVGQLFDPRVAQAWGVLEGMTYILIHSGSRGFGHQVCQDTLDSFLHKGFARNLPDLQLAAAPIKSPEGQLYFQAMAAAANFAFNNRQQILHAVREAFHEVLQVEPRSIKLLYDVCHNIAKFETHLVDGKLKRLCVHRKGATRAFGSGAEELSPLFRATGQPVIVPGDMGRASHLMVGKGNPLTWCSACHGAGRALSRVKSKKAWAGKNIYDYMSSKGVKVLASSDETVAEEMPDAYKDVEEVVCAVEEASLADRVARLKPGLVIKG